MGVLGSIARNTAGKLMTPVESLREGYRKGKRDLPKIPAFTRAAFRGGYRKTKDTATGWRRE